MTPNRRLPRAVERGVQWLRDQTPTVPPVRVARRRVIERGVGLADNVHVTAYDVSGLRERYPRWEEWPKHTRRRYVEAAAPTRWSGSTHNVTCQAWHEYCARLNNFHHDYEAIADPPSTVALGTDDSSFAVGDTALNNKVGEINLTDPSDSGDTWGMSEYLASTELNGHTLRELGIVSESGQLYNHAAFPSPTAKDSSLALIIEASVPFGDQSEI